MQIGLSESGVAMAEESAQGRGAKRARRRCLCEEKEEEEAAACEERRRRAAMVNDPACSDLLLQAQDGVCVWANRGILAETSPVLRAMLTNGITLDSISSSVALPSIPSAALLPLLEFLYTGSPSPSRFPLTISSAPLVFDAARFLLLPALQHSASSSFARYLLSLTSIPPSDAPSLLSQALCMSLPPTHPALSMLASLIPRALTLDLQTISLFSADALAFFLERTRNGSFRFDPSEYSRFRCVILWCAASVAPSGLAGLLCDHLPALEDAASALGDRSPPQEELKHSADKIRLALKPWLFRLDLFRINADVLTDVLQPLDIIPQTYLAHVLAFQVHFWTDMIYLRWRSLPASNSEKQVRISVLDEDHCIKCSLQGANVSRSFLRLRPPGSMVSRLCTPPQFAVAEMPITQAMGSHAWDFVIEKESAFMAVGFCSDQALSVNSDDDGTWLGYQPFGWVLCLTGQLFHNNKIGSPYGGRLTTGSRVRVHVDMITLTCSFTINGKAHGIAWRNIPSKIYPAAALTVLGKIRIEPAVDHRNEKLLKCLGIS